MRRIADRKWLVDRLSCDGTARTHTDDRTDRDVLVAATISTSLSYCLLDLSRGWIGIGFDRCGFCWIFRWLDGLVRLMKIDDFFIIVHWKEDNTVLKHYRRICIAIIVCWHNVTRMKFLLCCVLVKNSAIAELAAHCCAIRIFFIECEVR